MTNKVQPNPATPPDNRKVNRVMLLFSALLLAAWGVWFLSVRFNPRSATPPAEAADDSVPIANPAAPSLPSHAGRGEVRIETIHASHQAEIVRRDAALAATNSPVNSRDLDQNREWARRFPNDAFAWLQTAPAGEQRLAITEIVCPELVQSDPNAAVALVEKCPGSATNDVAQNLLDNLAQQWAAQDARAAIVWALAKPAGEQRDRLLQRIAFVESQQDPAEAAQLIADQMSPGPVQNEAAISVLYQWAQQDVSAALAWAENFPEGDLRQRAISEVRNVAAFSQTPPQETKTN